MARVRDEGRVWLYRDSMREFFGGDETVLYPDCGGAYMNPYIFI